MRGMRFFGVQLAIWGRKQGGDRLRQTGLANMLAESAFGCDVDHAGVQEDEVLGLRDDRSRLAHRLWSQFAGLDPAHVAVVKLAAASQARRVGRGEVVVAEGEMDDAVYLVAEGTLRTVRFTQNGHEVWYADVGPGELTGDMAALTGSRRTSSVVAKSIATLFAVEREDFLAVASQHPQFTLAVARMLARRLHATSTQLAELAALPVSSRVHGELAAMGTPARSDSEVFEIEPPPTVLALSQRIHATREATSRAVTVLEERGFLVRARRRWQVIVPTEASGPD